MNLLIAAQSGWGKSHTAQEKLERNIPDVDIVAVLDYDDEYRGLVKSGLCRWHPAGPEEAGKGDEFWFKQLVQNKKLVIPSYQLKRGQWRRVVANVGKAMRRIYQQTQSKYKMLICIDEAHTVAPQRASYPDAIDDIATAGRGEMMSGIWITQRMAKLNNTINTQCHAVYAGGFTDDSDYEKLSVSYPNEVHNPKARNVPPLPEELQVDGQNVPLRKWEEGGSIVGSEWIYSDDHGRVRRDDRRNVDMQTTHYGNQGYRLEI